MGKKVRFYVIETLRDGSYRAVWINERGEYVETVTKGRDKAEVARLAEQQGFVAKG